MITYVYAEDLKGGIGYQNDLPWKLPNDMKFFKKVTMGHTILMGRSTFESMDCRLLPGRQTVVLTRSKDYGKDIEGLKVVHNVEEVIELAKDQELMVIGGAGVFASLMDHVDQIIRTKIEAEFPADTFMPEIDEKTFRLNKTIQAETDEKNPYSHRFEWWVRR